MKKALLIISVVVLGGLLIPFNTTLVPEWRVRVVDEQGSPYRSKLVRQFCDDYRLGVSPCSDANDSMKLTNEDGFVVFPERKITMNALTRIARSVFNLFGALLHGSYKVDIYLDSSGRQGTKTLKYVLGQPLPETFILPTKPDN